MSKKIFIHQRESGEDSETHLQENIKKFQSDAEFLHKQMLQGERLTAKTVVQKYGIADRRLRDLHEDGKCKKEWKLNEKGKRLYVEYFIPQHERETKKSLTEWWTNYVKLNPGTKLIQTDLF